MDTFVCIQNTQFLFVTLKLIFVSDLLCNNMLYLLLNFVFYLGRGHKKSILLSVLKHHSIPHHHIFGKIFYCFACAATIGSCTNSCEHIYNFPWNVQITNIKTIKSENILAWNTSKHYFVDIHKTKHLHREEKQFKVQRRKWKKIECDKQYCPWLCSPNQNRFTDHAKCFEQMKFPKPWKNYTWIFFACWHFLSCNWEETSTKSHYTCFFSYLSRLLE